MAVAKVPGRRSREENVNRRPHSCGRNAVSYGRVVSFSRRIPRADRAVNKRWTASTRQRERARHSGPGVGLTRLCTWPAQSARIKSSPAPEETAAQARENMRPRRGQEIRQLELIDRNVRLSARAAARLCCSEVAGAGPWRTPRIFPLSRSSRFVVQLR